jgi:hypothetical protein
MGVNSMLVKNNAYWRRVIKMGKRTPRKSVCTSGPVNYDWSCKTLRVVFVRYHPGAKTIARRLRQGRPAKADVDGRLSCYISPGRY